MTDQTQRVVVEKLGALGDGVTANGVFVPGALPGETVEGVVEDSRIAKMKIVTPSTDRIRPPCRHAKACGGCTVQHATDTLVANWKTDIVVQALARAGLDPQILPIQTSPARSRRRASLAGRRLKSGAVVGFHGRAADTVLSVPDCQLLLRELLTVVPALEEMTVTGGSRRGEVTFAMTATEGGIDVAANGGRDLNPDLLQSLAAISGRAELARLTWNGDLVAAREDPLVQMGKAMVPIPPAAFLQATKDGQQTLVKAVQEALKGSNQIVDLFAGAGTFALGLAENTRVHAVEGEGELLQALDAGWRHSSGLKSVTTEVRDLFRNPILPEDLTPYDGAVVDPPRAGAEAQIHHLAASTIPRIAYVSCNPTTFARDAAKLVAEGFTLNWVLPVDQFRWSPHVELAASFSRDT